MKILKSFCMAVMVLFMLNATVSTASTLNEVSFNHCSEEGSVMTLEIPALNFVADIQLPQSSFDAVVTIELTDSEGNSVEIDIDGTTALIRGDGINARNISGDGINAIIRGDGINARGGIRSDGINALIRGDGINPSVVTVTQLGVVIFSEEL